MNSPMGKSMMGTQANSRLKSSPSFGFGTEERTKVGGSKMYVSKDHCTDKFGTNSPGPVYYSSTVLPVSDTRFIPGISYR